MQPLIEAKLPKISAPIRSSTLSPLRCPLLKLMSRNRRKRTLRVHVPEPLWRSGQNPRPRRFLASKASKTDQGGWLPLQREGALERESPGDACHLSQSEKRPVVVTGPLLGGWGPGRDCCGTLFTFRSPPPATVLVLRRGRDSRNPDLPSFTVHSLLKAELCFPPKLIH